MEHQLRTRSFPWTITTTEGVCRVQRRHEEGCSWIPVAPEDAAALDVHFGLFAFTFQSYYTALSIYIHLNREDIRCVTRMACVELYVRKNSVLRFS